MMIKIYTVVKKFMSKNSRRGEKFTVVKNSHRGKKFTWGCTYTCACVCVCPRPCPCAYAYTRVCVCMCVRVACVARVCVNGAGRLSVLSPFGLLVPFRTGGRFRSYYLDLTAAGIITKLAINAQNTNITQ